MELLSTLAFYFRWENANIQSMLEGQWLILRPKLAAMSPPAEAGLNAFRQTLVARLAAVPHSDRGLLHWASVTGLLTMGNAAQLKQVGVHQKPAW